LFVLPLIVAAALAQAPQRAPADPASPPAPGAAAERWWPRWRGPDGDGAAPSSNPPVTWSEAENIRWKTRIPGEGCSSAIVWKDRVYVTTAIETEAEGAPSGEAPPPPPDRGGRRRRPSRPAPTKVHEFAVLALDRADGRIVWSTTVAEAVPHESGHATGSQASSSAVTDGRSLFVCFGSRGVHCLDLDGKIRWSRDLGRMRTRNQFGEGSSPALWEDTLVITWDHEGPSFILALNKESGEELWRQPRDERTSWATPIVVSVAGRPLVIAPGTTASRAYDLRSGKVVWSCSGMTMNCIPTPIHRDGVVWLMSGFRGAALQAIRLEGCEGDISESQHILWSRDKATSYVPSALLYQGLLYYLRSNSGVLSCVDAATGKLHYEGERLADLRTVYSSPVGASGRVYVSSREGVTKVIAAGPQCKVLATNRLDDVFDGSAAIVGDALYLRGRKHLYCIAAPE
jgi:outer membrane protein assembly factor BamB